MNKSIWPVAFLLAAGVAAISIYVKNLNMSNMDNGRLEGKKGNHDFTDEQVGRFFKQRRTKLMEQCSNGIILLSNCKATSENFLYLTGFDEPNAVCVLVPGSDKPFRLYVEPDNPVMRLWTGSHYGVSGAIQKFGADEAFSIDELTAQLPDLLSGHKLLYYIPADSKVQDLLEELKTEKPALADPVSLLEEMRVIKDEYEIRQLKRAAAATCDGYIRALKTAAPGKMEYEIQAEVEYAYKRNGMSPGYTSIIGSGPNATVLHYDSNNRRMESGDLLLMDAAAACNHYSADLTRTIPVNGKFAPMQKEMYELVLHALQEGMKEMIPGKRILDCHHTATRIIIEGLYNKGLITDSSKFWQRRFYIHYRNDHYIGLNVHDVGSYGDFNASARDEYIVTPAVRGRLLEPGMVLTMEPGIYLSAERIDQLKEIFPDVPQEEIDAFLAKVKPVYMRYAGIGIRIEDDILITREGNEILTAVAPKGVEEIEEMMKK